MKIFLLGLPGSGKTTLGKEVAKALDLSFVDLDSEIEKGAAKKITAIFQEKGENCFRELERDELQKWCAQASGFVMATGGGTPCFFDNMDQINQSGKSIFLDVPAAVIAMRVRNSGFSERPMLAALQPDELKDKIEFLRSHRINFYKKAHQILQGEKITLDQILRILKA